MAETSGDQRGKAQRLSVRLQGSEHLAVGGAKSPREAPSSPAAGAADDKLEAALLQLRDVASDAKLLRGEHVAERQRALATASGVELLPHRFCFSAEPPLANETHTASSRATTATTPLDFEIGARPALSDEQKDHPGLKPAGLRPKQT